MDIAPCGNACYLKMQTWHFDRGVAGMKGELLTVQYLSIPDRHTSPEFQMASMFGLCPNLELTLEDSDFSSLCVSWNHILSKAKST